jgi:CspA family cold shock protein
MIQFFQKLFGSSTTQNQNASSNGRKAGEVRFFNRRKGFGFIESPDLDKDIFVHARDLNQSIKKGDKVTFLIGEDSKGPRAVDVALRSGG